MNSRDFIRVALVEDDAWLGNAIARQLRAAPGFTFVQVYRSGEEALHGLLDDAPDVVLMDINLPRMSGIECVRQLKQRLPEVNVLMLTVYEESELIFRSLQAGAAGYLLKRTVRTDLVDAIRQAHEGGSPMTGLIARKVVQHFQEMGAHQSELEKLSPREKEILELLSEGAAYKEIADRLSVSMNTIRMHIRGIYRKLEVHSRGEAVARYFGK